MVEFFQSLREAGLLAAVFVIGALTVMLATVGGGRVIVRVSPKVRDALLGCGLAFMGASLGGYVISLQTGSEMPVPPPIAAALTATSPLASPPTLTGSATYTPESATPTSIPAKPTPIYTPGSSSVSSALQCDPQVYYGIQHCTQGAVQVLRIDPKAPRVRFETVLPQGYDRRGNFGECRDVNIPRNSTGPGCQVNGKYPAELVGDMAGRYPGAVAAFNADFFGHTHGPEGLTVKNGVRLDGIYGDHDEMEVTRGSLSISSDGDVRIGIVDRDSLPNPSKPWTWLPDPLAYHNSVGGIPLLVHDGDPVNIKRQCTIQTPPDRSECPSSKKRCTIKTRPDRGKCPPPNAERARTAVGKTEDGQLIVVVVPELAGLTLYQLRDTLIGLGAVEAVNLDGGGSSQLWYDGDYIITSTRPVANGLLVFSQVGQPPAAPSNLSATPVNQTGIHLTWTDNSDSEDGFKILRDGSQIATVGADVTSYDDDDWGHGAVHRYNVKAHNSFGDSRTSNTAIATINTCPGCPG